MQHANKTRGIGPLGSSGVIAQWGAASFVRSVQRGTINITSAASATATISAVNTDNSVIRYLSFSNGGISQNDVYPTLQLTNSTTVTATRYNTSANSTQVVYEVTEYMPGVIKSVQRGTVTLTATPTNTTITAVGDMAKTSVDWLGWRFNNTSAPTTYIQMWCNLTSTTNLQSQSNAGGSNQEFTYQITEWY